ncbi:MAG: hypothetical protein Q8Q35_02390 [Nanoarchaeota archaeon]|nr:hypothetical protein [Nanoarchaeota archaeon]
MKIKTVEYKTPKAVEIKMISNSFEVSDGIIRVRIIDVSIPMKNNKPSVSFLMNRIFDHLLSVTILQSWFIGQTNGFFLLC